MSGRTARTAIALAALLMLAVACASDDAAPGGGATGPTTGGGRYGGGGTDDDGGGGGKAVETVIATNFSFAPKKLKVEAGSKIEIENRSAGAPHTFTIVGTDIDVVLEPMASEDATIDLDPGTYAFICRYHERSGMEGTITVT